MTQSMIVTANPLNTMGMQNFGAGKAADTSNASTTGNSASTNGTDSIGSTFLSLLVQELQNQDPTAPMDSTAMVGQMISLNQLDQLTSINQVLTGAYGGTSNATAGSTEGSSAGGSSSPSGQGLTSPATAAAMRLLSHGSVATQPAVSTSVTLPALR